MNFEKIHHFELLYTNDNTNDPELLEQMSRLSLENIPKSVETTQDETQIHKTLLMKNNSDVLEAKRKELDQWKKEGVYTEHTNQGQDCISLRWVVKEKLVDEKRIVKARLCAQDFEEQKCFRTDSPTCGDKVWEFKKCVYGLAYASRYWYLKLGEELIRSGATSIQLDQGIFILHKDNKPFGTMSYLVDDAILPMQR